MFLRKLTVILVPLALLVLLALLLPVLSSLGPFFGSLLLGILLGISLGLLLPHQFLASQGTNLPLLRLLATNDTRLITLEGAFAAYMITFSVRTGKGI